MKTDELIAILAKAPPPRRLQITACTAALVALSVLVTQVLLHVRPEVLALAPSPSLLMKLTVLGLVALTAVRALREQSVPVARHWAQYLALIPGLLLAGLIVQEWRTTEPAQIAALFHLREFPFCLLFVMLYGLIGAAGLAVHLQRAAPPDPRRAAAAIGFAAAAAGAIGYALHCPIDSPTFIAVAYGIALALTSVLARLMLPRFLKW